MHPDILGILLGALCGAAIGVERQWSGHASGPKPHFAGVRTQTLLGVVSALAGWLWTQGMEAVSITLLAGAIAVIVVAYAAISRRDLDATTEVAALVVVAAGFLAGHGSWNLASGITVVTALLLVEKSRLHSWIARIPDVGLRASFRFALMAVVILPLLPAGPYEPLGGIDFRALWMLVLLFSGISFAAYVVRSLRGAARGYLWAGALGGLISSTNVTLTFSRIGRTEPGAGRSLALGVVAACTLLNFRVLAAATVLNPGFGRKLAPLVAGPAIVGIAFLWLAYRKQKPKASEPPAPSQPLHFWSALQMAALFQVVLFLTAFVQQRWGSTGLIVSGGFLGLTDVDALVASMAKVGSEAAATATGVGIIANTVLKLAIAVILGTETFRRVAVAGLILLGIATAASVWWFSSLAKGA